jgi:hypothetical protein
MKLHAHLLAESANFATDGTFTVFKGGITEAFAPGFPTLVKVALLTRLELTADEAADLIELHLQILLEDKPVAPEVHQPLAVTVQDPAKPVYVNSIAELGLAMAGPGRLTIAARINEMPLPLLYFFVAQLGAPPRRELPGT